MTKPIVAIDIDDVLADYSAEFAVSSNRLWGTQLTADDYHEDWMKVWDIEFEEVLERGKALFEDRIHERLRHKDGAAEVLTELADDFDLMILTARGDSTKAATLEWFARHYPMIDHGNITFANLWANPEPDMVHRTKGDIAKGLGVRYIIDDQLKHCVAAAAHGIEALLFGDYTWNQSDQLPQGVTRVKHWQDVRAYFERQRATS
jgi:5'(3')-deoxyribonucleotidase